MPRSHASSELVLSFQTDPNSARAAFLRRAMSTLERIAAAAPAKALNEALAAPTGAGALAQLLSHTELIGAAIADLIRSCRRSRALPHMQAVIWKSN